MSNTAAHLIDRVIAPDLTLRQWVLTVPFELRLLLAAQPEALSAIALVFVQEIGRCSASKPERSATTRNRGRVLLPAFWLEPHLNIQWHVIVPDAVFLPDARGRMGRHPRHSLARKARLPSGYLDGQ